MRKRIDSHTYDTSTATAIGSYDNGSDEEDAFRAELFRTRSGYYFLHERGGASSRVGRVVGRGRCIGGEDIRDLTCAEAEEWARLHLPDATVKAEFGAADPEDQAEAQLSMWIPRSVYNAIRRRATRERCTMADLVVRSFCTYDKEHPDA